MNNIFVNNYSLFILCHRKINVLLNFRSTYNHLSSWLTDTRNLTNPSTVIFLIGNKSDLDGQRDVTYEEAKQFADENGLMFVEASAKT